MDSQRGRGWGRSRGRSRGAPVNPSAESAKTQQQLQQQQIQPSPHARPVTAPSVVVPPGAVPAPITSVAPSVGRARGRSRGQSPMDPSATRVTHPQQMQPGRPSQGPVSQAGTVAVQAVVSRAAYRGVEKPANCRQGWQQRLTDVTAAMGEVMMEGAVGNGSGSGNGDNGDDNGNEHSVGRGVMRGRREIGQITWTKPENITSKRGTQGQAIIVRANYFTLDKKLDWKLCLYHVDFSPDEDRTSERKRMMRQHKEVLGQNYLFDGMQLYLPFKLGTDVTELASKRESDQAVYSIRLKFIKELSPLDSQFLQIMNIIMKRCLEYLGLQMIGRNYFNSKAEMKEERLNIAIWPGYSTSIRQHENSLLLNAEIMHKFLRTETAYDVLRRCNNPKTEGPKHLLGAIVMTIYNEKTYRIDEIEWTVNPSSKFPYKGDEITYMDYYKKNYQVGIRDPRQPMLMSRPKKRDLRRGAGNIYLVPELCKMTGLTEEMRGDFNMMKDLATYMRVGPDKRVQSLLKFNRDLASNEKVNQELVDWGLKLSPNLIQVQGRVLPAELIIQGGRELSYNRKSSEWSREIRSLRLNVPVDIPNWAIVFPRKFSNDARELTTTLQRVAQPMGMSFGQPAVYQLNSDQSQEYIQQLNQCSNAQFILVILPNDRADRYSAIKRHCSLKMGIATQCILSRTLFKKQRLMSVATKVALQINCKLGGEPWNVAIPIKNAMVIGYDTYHDKGTKGASVGAVVSSLNQQWTKYLSQAARHNNQEELTDNFTLGVRNALQYYQQENGTQPNMVIVYRDGVGDGQIDYVREHEITAIKRCFSEVLEKPPKFAFVIVSKRINTRLFIDNHGNPDNPPPGTVVDDVITLPERYDFFLVSQSVNQGTVSPTSFNIIDDTTGLKPDHMQRLAYKLCHLYYNWQGTIRVPAPCMLAHKMAFITGQSVHGQPHRDLWTRLWYL
ncbi:hypothetical protein Pmani_014444 [Petrolisthes manimaculis]|uniref:Piwi n=1 Tax=Petrolisthes manimaculis TaxID=1843537 RepID=A0AAE1PTM4_9EUCA|nr:hypothetical protein Pmani_014444 [Petrolisthes manimaculis]